MSDTPTHDDSTDARAPDGPAQSRREFVRRAALISLPVVLATIPSRTVWAGPRRPTGTQLDASAGGSVNPSGNTATSKVKSLF
jgi:hypothetical protein